MTNLTVKRTLWEWNVLGYKVRKGSKAIGYTKGIALFNDERVVAYPRRTSSGGLSRSRGYGDDTPDRDGGFWQDFADACNSEYGD